MGKSNIDKDIKKFNIAEDIILRGNSIEHAKFILEKVIMDNYKITGGRVYILRIATRQVINFIEEYENKGTLDTIREKVKVNNENNELKSELEELKETLKCTQGSWYKDTQKLETYKKIAEFLAEEVKKEILHYDVQGINYCELSYENDYMKRGKCSKHNNSASCIQCIIDWAKSEVLKDGP